MPEVFSTVLGPVNRGCVMRDCDAVQVVVLCYTCFQGISGFDTRSPRGMIRGVVISLVGLVAGHRGIGNGTVGLI